MQIINITYKVPLNEVDEHLLPHREFLDKQYDAGNFLASGPKTPRDGGVILSTGKVSLDELHEILKSDPFYIHDIADYQVVDFTPVKHQSILEGIIK
ncbi:GTP cyclohydrolase [Escherichia coli]|nr:GTP cyclohydrolase [Escherichia coli]